MSPHTTNNNSATTTAMEASSFVIHDGQQFDLSNLVDSGNVWSNSWTKACMDTSTSTSNPDLLFVGDESMSLLNLQQPQQNNNSSRSSLIKNNNSYNKKNASYTSMYPELDESDVSDDTTRTAYYSDDDDELIEEGPVSKVMVVSPNKCPQSSLTDNNDHTEDDDISLLTDDRTVVLLKQYLRVQQQQQQQEDESSLPSSSQQEQQQPSCFLPPPPSLSSRVAEAEPSSSSLSSLLSTTSTTTRGEDHEPLSQPNVLHTRSSSLAAAAQQRPQTQPSLHLQQQQSRYESFNRAKQQLHKSCPSILSSNNHNHNNHNHSPPEDRRRHYIHVAPLDGLDRLPLHGTEETMMAVRTGNVCTVSCWTCGHELGCIKSALYVLCPSCRCISPLTSSLSQDEDDVKLPPVVASCSGTNDKAVRGVGLGYTIHPSRR